ncbi:hypothetical protein DSM112329_00245 [Paraconexibacter sp. AEG42_29]|uniref:Orc1-like AAA ATPase domain-containing protein n=1 Tax=Paraconexibacter sp. AEG42_29 TaxID=2997339 RepID=A0AAU7AP89_9ACTN
MAWRDETTFVGRDRELRLFDRLLDDGARSSVVFCHGPGGVGKSTLLREVARRAVRRGYTPVLVEGRDLAPVPGQLEAALAGVAAHERPLVMFDTYERMSAAGGYLRSRVLPALPEGALVVVAGRRAPEPGWLADGWEHITTALELGPLGDDEAAALVAQHGLDDAATVTSLVRWANGSPLALALGAEAAATSDGDADAPRLTALDDDPDLAQALLQRLARAELDGGDLDVLAVASIARVTYASMLQDVLPGTDSEEAEAWLRGLSFAEPVGAGVTLHDLVRRALRAELRRRDPDRERELRRRVADHLYARASAGEGRFMVDLADLVDDPIIRWGFGANTSAAHRVDHVRAGDVDTAEELFLARKQGAHGWWSGTRRFFEEAPQRIVVARDDTDALCGVCVAVTPHNAPAFAEQDRVLGPWLAHARATIPDGNVLVWRDAIDLTTPADGHEASPVVAILNKAAMLRSGLVNQRWSYLPIDPDNPIAAAFAAAVGARHEPSLDVVFSTGRTVQCHILDHGAGGVLGMTRDAVYRELGLAPPTSVGTAPPPRAADFEDVREALRVLHQPLALAASPLASGTGAADRAASVRELITTAVASVFGDSVDETLLRRIIERGYLDPQGGHELAALELNVSRATYFRRLRRACDRVAEYVIASRA